MAVQEYQLSKNEKQAIANRINYFRVLPNSVRKMAGDLEAFHANSTNNFVDHREKSVLVGGRVMVLNISQ